MSAETFLSNKLTFIGANSVFWEPQFYPYRKVLLPSPGYKRGDFGGQKLAALVTLLVSGRARVQI